MMWDRICYYLKLNNSMDDEKNSIAWTMKISITFQRLTSGHSMVNAHNNNIST